MVKNTFVSLPQLQILEVYIGLEDKLQIFPSSALHEGEWLASLLLFILGETVLSIHWTRGWIGT